MAIYQEYYVSYDPTFIRAASLSAVYYAPIAMTGYFGVCSIDSYLYLCNIVEQSDIEDFETNFLPGATQLALPTDAIAYAILDQASQQKYDLQATVMYLGQAQPGVLTSEGSTIT